MASLRYAEPRQVVVYDRLLRLFKNDAPHVMDIISPRLIRQFTRAGKIVEVGRQTYNRWAEWAWWTFLLMLYTLSPT
jgi:hypothetical protein